MYMNISFKGIENLKILKKIQQNEGFVQVANDKQLPAIEDLKIVKIRCDLTNDQFGDDFDSYSAVLNKVCENSGENYRNHIADNECEIEVNKRIVTVLDKKYKTTKISLNGRDIELKDDHLLPIYTFVAKLMNKLYYSEVTTPEQKSYVKFVNKNVNKKACDYLEMSE